ncbi:MAG: hypothetical protein F6J87_07040 [Spirulina sp. SIO3F2]|nr:hypothetical protein [Spirulina sp. SIO3F2]
MSENNSPTQNILLENLKTLFTGVIALSIIIGGIWSFGGVMVVSIVCTLGIALLIWLPLFWLLGRLTLAAFNYCNINGQSATPQQKFGDMARTVIMGFLGVSMIAVPLGVFGLVALIDQTPKQGWIVWLLVLWLAGRLTPRILNVLGINLSNFALGGSRSGVEGGEVLPSLRKPTPQQQSLVNYIRKAQAKGFSESQIQSRLNQQGWSNTEIEQAQAMVSVV